MTAARRRRALPTLLRLLVLLPLAACAGSQPPPRPAGDEVGGEHASATPPPPTASEPSAEPSPPSPGSGPGPATPSATTASTPVLVPHPPIRALVEAVHRGEGAALGEIERLAGTLRGAARDQALLALGGLHVADERWRDALGPLRRAAAGEVAAESAALLFARAVAEGRIVGSVDEARALIAPVVVGAGTPALAAEARWRAFQLENLAGAWPEAARKGLELLASGPPAEDGRLEPDELRWLTAEALRLAGRTEEAVALYRTIWRETPGSARALEARERLTAAGVEVVPPEGGERLAWIETMQGAGLHREALAELAPLIAASGDPGLRAQAHAAAARSRYVLRENRRVVELAETLRREAPDSAAAAEAALVAMRALGRDDRIADLRAWEAWLRSAHPEHPATAEARYYLGAILAGTPGEEEAALELLREVAAGGGARGTDALWRIAWTERGLGRDAAARHALERLLTADTGGGYRAASLYWLARLAEDPGSEATLEVYRTVRREFPRDYYATAAAERLRELGQPPPPVSGQPTTLPAPDPLTDPTRRPEPAYRRAVELAALGLPRLAAEELATLDLEGDPALALGLARLHARGGDPWSAIGLLLARFDEDLEGVPLGAPGVSPEVWESFYPFPFQETVRRVTASDDLVPPGVEVDPWLIAAQARRESRFTHRARSPAGAVGLLQLMPETAAAVARRLGRPAQTADRLFEPEVNLALGTAELARLVAAFDGAWAPALAGYNAGETVAREWWQARPPGQPLDEWIETIPYTETRLYVKAILGTYPIYRELYPEAG